MEVSVRQLPGEPVGFAEATGPGAEFAPFAPDSAWGPAWTTSWFRLTGSVPDDWPEGDVAAVIDLGFEGGPGFQAEGLVYRPDGTIIKGVHPMNSAVGLARVGGEIELFVEAAANPDITTGMFLPTPLGDGLDPDGTPLYRFRSAELVLIDQSVEQLGYDLDVLIGWAELLPADQPRRARIVQALGDACDAIDIWDVSGTALAARDRLARVLASPSVPTAHRLAAVGHAHIDSAWLWPMRETVRKCTRTFANVLELMDRYPEFVFACSQAQQYAWIEERQPELFERIGKAVAAGRFIPAGGMWVESDTNMVGGEALVRQFVLGKRYFQDRFGVEPREVWLPDSFGYTAALPQIARLAGYRWFLTQKLAWNPTNPFPHHTFWWEGIDGSRIFAHMPPVDSYLASMTPTELNHAATNFRDHSGAGTSMVPFGHGDGGGGPTAVMLERARRQADFEGSPTIEHLSPTEFFETAEAEYPDAPTWVGELYMEAHRGTYTSQAAMKRGNRRTEHLLREAELWWTTAAVRTGASYPYDDLDRLWKVVLLHQFHDVLPGSSIARVHREARQAYAEVIAELESLIADAISLLVGPGDQLLRLNPAPVPSGGLSALGAAIGPEPHHHAVRLEADDAGWLLDNGILRVHVAADGTVDSVVDQRIGREVLPAGCRANDLILFQDLPNAFDAWDIDSFYEGTGTAIRQVVAITAQQDDPDRAGLTVERQFAGSTSTQTIMLSADSDQVDFSIDIDWHTQESLLKVAFPVDLRSETAASEIQFGHIRRPTHANTTWDEAKFETCAHRWVQIGEPDFGVAVINDATYGHDIRRRDHVDPAGHAATRPGTDIRLSLLRGPRYPDPEADQGRHRANYGLVVGAGVPQAVAAGLRLNLPIRRVRGGHAPQPLVTVSGDGLVIESIKLAEDRSGDVVVRLYEAHGSRSRGRLDWDFPATNAELVDLLERPLSSEPHPGNGHADGIDLELKPFEIITVRVQRGRRS
jgi:alpha-mannosidase